MVQLRDFVGKKAKKSLLSSLCLGFGILTQLSAPALAQDDDQIANGQWFDSNAADEPEINRNPEYLLTLNRTDFVNIRLVAEQVDVEPVVLIINRQGGFTIEGNTNGNVSEFNGFLQEGEYIVIAATEKPNQESKFTISTDEGDFDGLHVEHRTVDSQGEEDDYYEEIDPNDEKLTLDDWLDENGFNDLGAPILIAGYYNAGDLGLGRDMFCNQDGSLVACCSSNYGTPGKDDAIEALQALINKDVPAATVCMEANRRNRDNPVTFWVYNGAGERINFLQLDNQEAKSVPGVCLNCHGGEYDDDDITVTGARFLPFDLDTFEFAREDFSEASQSEIFRELNAMVARVEEGNDIAEFINNVYGGDVERRGAVWNRNYVPDAWKDAGESMQYTYVVKPYCRNCHLGIDISLENLGQIDKANFEDFICGFNPEAPIMPHAEFTDAEFWNDETAVNYAVSDYDECMEHRFGLR
ncbi:MAG: hypothetical protein P8Y42_19310 [Exilibacterium sp.]